MSVQAIKDKLKLGIHVIMVGFAIRGIMHGHLDMCGLPVRPFEHRGEVKADVKRRAPGSILGTVPWLTAFIAGVSFLQSCRSSTSSRRIGANLRLT
jgi:hypothetical protein